MLAWINRTQLHSYKYTSLIAKVTLMVPTSSARCTSHASLDVYLNLSLSQRDIPVDKTVIFTQVGIAKVREITSSQQTAFAAPDRGELWWIPTSAKNLSGENIWI